MAQIKKKSNFKQKRKSKKDKKHKDVIDKRIYRTPKLVYPYEKNTSSKLPRIIINANHFVTPLK